MWLFYELKHCFCFLLTRSRSRQSSSQSRQSQGRIHWREWEHPEEEPVGKNNNRTIVMLCNGYFNTITVQTNTKYGITAEKHILKYIIIIILSPSLAASCYLCRRSAFLPLTFRSSMSLWYSPSQYFGRVEKIEFSVTSLPNCLSNQSDSRSLEFSNSTFTTKTEQIKSIFVISNKFIYFFHTIAFTTRWPNKFTVKI